MYGISKNSWHLIGSLTGLLVVPKVSLFIAFPRARASERHYAAVRFYAVAFYACRVCGN